jgi:hypothetical protein
LEVTDNGSDTFDPIGRPAFYPDSVSLQLLTASATNCDSLPPPRFPADNWFGDIVVTDSQPPPKPRFFKVADCRLGGWARIGFKGRRQCDNFVRWQCREGRHSYYGFSTIYHCRQAIKS